MISTCIPEPAGETIQHSGPPGEAIPHGSPVESFLLDPLPVYDPPCAPWRIGEK